MFIYESLLENLKQKMTKVRKNNVNTGIQNSNIRMKNVNIRTFKYSLPFIKTLRHLFSLHIFGEGQVLIKRMQIYSGVYLCFYIPQV